VYRPHPDIAGTSAHLRRFILPTIYSISSGIGTYRAIMCAVVAIVAKYARGSRTLISPNSVEYGVSQIKAQQWPVESIGPCTCQTRPRRNRISHSTKFLWQRFLSRSALDKRQIASVSATHLQRMMQEIYCFTIQHVKTYHEI